MKLYISGAMTGIENFNFPLFNSVATELRKMGFWVLNPAENPIFERYGEYLLHDLIGIHYYQIDAIVLLPNSLGSNGVKMELKTALSLGLPIIPSSEILGL